MPRLRKSKSTANISVSSPTSPTELVPELTSRRDSRALAATSSAIALSIGSAIFRARDTSNDGATVQGRYTDWQTAYAAARMVVEIAKESSDMFLPLKAVVGAMTALMKNYDQTSDNAGKVKEIERRAQSLSGVLASPVSEEDYVEKGRRVVLRRKLEGVVAKLEPFSEQQAFLRFLRNVDNAKTLAEFVQELADAITDYQVSVQQGVYEGTRSIHNEAKNIRDDTKNILWGTKIIHHDTKNILEAADLDILAKLEPVRNAGFRAGHHDRCLPGTRKSVLQDIMVWAKNPLDKNVYWLNGLAGTGKSTIAQSFSEMIASDGSLGASFFCSRDYLDRRELKNIFPTLAYQLACRYPHFRSHIITIIKKDPTIAHTSLISQLENLLVDPLSGGDVSCVIVIDALDECNDDQPASAILSVLGQFVKQLSPVKFFITGRPEPRIRTGFRLPLLEPLTQIFLLHKVEPSAVDSDIQLYLSQRLTAIAKQRSDLQLPDPWPHKSEIITLTKKSSGLFIFASTLVRFIGSEYHEPTERLQLVISEANSTTHEGRAGIDFLYSQILLHAFSGAHEPAVFGNMRRVLGAVVLAFNPLSRKELSILLGTPIALISTTLRHLHSVILIPTDETEEIRVFHKSFPDYLQDNERCTDPRFLIDPKTHHGDMVLSCLELVSKLKRNPCSLPLFVVNQDIPNLQQLLRNKLGGAMQYACSHWVRHLEISPTSGDYVGEVIVLAIRMLQNAPLWIEVMSLENHLEEVIHSMYGLLAWLNTANYMAQHGAIMTREITTLSTIFTELRDLEDKANGWSRAKVLTTLLNDLATDCLRLSMYFFHPIQQCAQQVYHTAIPLSPTSSQLQKSCLQSVIDNQLSHVVTFSGASSTWGLLLRTIDTRPRELTCIATSSQRIIAACEDIVNIYDAVTGVLWQPLCAPEIVTKIQVSPDGSTLFFAHSFSVTMWDVQTGGLIHTFTLQSKISDIATPITGDHVACGTYDGSVVFWNIHTKEEGKGFRSSQPIVALYWLSPLKLTVATQSSVCIYDITTGKTSNSQSTPHCVWGIVYLMDDREFLVGISQPSSRVGRERCFFETVFVQQCGLGPQDAGFIMGLRQSPTRRGQLSSPIVVGREVACITPPSGVQVYNIGTNNWTKNPPLLGGATSMAVSLNGNLVVQTRDSIQIFSVDVLTSGEDHNYVRPCHVYPLGENHIVCMLQPKRHLTILELETLRELSSDNDASPLGSSLANQSPSARVSVSYGVVAEFGSSVIVEAWQSGTPLPKWTEAADGLEDAPLGRLSPERTRIIIVYGSPWRELCVKDANDGIILAKRPLEADDLGTGKVYDLTFDSETGFHLKIDGPGWHVKIPYDIITSPSGDYSHTITKGEPVPLSEPREKLPYTLDVNCEWVLNRESRKVCWVSPANIRRGNGGHFWAGLSLVMVGGDGVVRKLTFKEPDC